MAAPRKAPSVWKEAEQWELPPRLPAKQAQRRGHGRVQVATYGRRRNTDTRLFTHLRPDCHQRKAAALNIPAVSPRLSYLFLLAFFSFSPSVGHTRNEGCNNGLGEALLVLKSSSDRNLIGRMKRFRENSLPHSPISSSSSSSCFSL